MQQRRADRDADRHRHVRVIPTAPSLIHRTPGHAENEADAPRRTLVDVAESGLRLRIRLGEALLAGLARARSTHLPLDVGADVARGRDPGAREIPAAIDPALHLAAAVPEHARVFGRKRTAREGGRRKEEQERGYCVRPRERICESQETGTATLRLGPYLCG